MSFGFSVGDFLAVLELANKVRQRWDDAPDEYTSLKEETKNVSVLLENVHKLSQPGTLSDEHIIQVKDNCATCLRVLQRCESLADKFPATTAGHSSLKSKWKRLQLDPNDVRAVRDQLVSCISNLHALLTVIQSFQVNRITRRVDSIRNHESRTLLYTIADWYSSDDFAKHQDHYLSLRLPGTVAWAVQDSKYKQWLDGDIHTLLCPGIPGSGKSILHAALVDDLRSRYEHDDDIVVVYFYCSFQRQAEQTIRNILSVLVRQMFQARHQLPLEVKALYDKHYPHKSSPSIDELEQLLRLLIQGYHKVFILIDAMDECMSNEGDCRELLNKIFNIQQAKTATKLLVTTRWLPNITDYFGSCPQLEIKAHQEDIERYLDHNIPRLPVKPHVKIKVDNDMVTIKDAVKSRIIDAADGMFLLARLQFDSLTDKTNPRKLQQALLQLSGGSEALESEYDKALLRIDQQREGFREVAYKVLTWIVYARKELSIEELREAVAIYEGMDDIDHDTDLEEEQQLASVCAGLVRIDHEAGVMRLVHYTTQKYLENALPRRSEGEISIARDCLTYLTMGVFQKPLLEEERGTFDTLREYKLFKYAMQHWGWHIKLEFELDLSPFIDGILFTPHLLVAIPFFVPGCLRRRYEISPAHVCAYFDMSSTLLRIIDQGGASDSKDSLGRTPLSWAATYGCTESVKVLLRRADVSVNSRDIEGRTPLHTAVEGGHLDIVEILLRRADIDINASANNGLVPLHLAVLREHADIIKLLLQQNGLIVTPDWRGLPILRDAVGHCDGEVFKLLIEWPEISIDQSTSGDTTPSTEAEEKRNLVASAVLEGDLEKLKLVMGNAYILNYPTPLNIANLLYPAAEGRTVEIMEYLLSLTDADLNSKDYFGDTLLCKAAQRRRPEIARSLLGHSDVDPELSDREGRTPLSHAAGCRSEEIVQCLLGRHGVNPESIDSHGRTPLSYAAEAGSVQIVEALLQRPGVNPVSADHDGRTPLSYATAGEFASSDVVRALLQRPEVNPESTDQHGRTPLSYAAEFDNKGVAKVLLEQPTVQPDSKDKQGRTPLSYAAANGSWSIVQTFMDLPEVDTEASDNNGLTPFLWATKGGHKVVGIFMRKWYNRADSAKAYATILQKAIQDVCATGEEFYLSTHPPILNVLGQCLISIGCRDWALFAFQQQITIEQDTLLASHNVICCDGCGMDPISGDRFVCLTCIDFDLCIACKQGYTNGNIFGDCVNHEFLEVPGQKNFEGALEGSDQLTEALHKLKLKSRDQSPTDPNFDSTVSKHWCAGIEERYDHWDFWEYDEHLEG